jgi:hypothetical protein
MCVSVVNIFDVLEEEPREGTEYFVETPGGSRFHATYKATKAFPEWLTDSGEVLLVTEGQKFRELVSDRPAQAIKIKG